MEQKLVKLQALSIIVKLATMGIGMVQGIMVLRILSPSSYGLVGIVLGIGGVISVYQYLGLSPGMTREISLEKDYSRASKIFVSALFIMMAFTLPIACLLFFLSTFIAEKIYGIPRIAVLLKLFALIIVFQGIRGIQGAVFNGLERFQELFIFEIISAVITFFAFVFLVRYHGEKGYFAALLLVSLVAVLLLSGIMFFILKMRITLPSVSEAKRIIAGISRTGIVMYLAQILYMVWQRAGILVLGLVALPAEAGYFTFALFYGLRMEMLCEAIGQINLPVMTRKYASEPGSFKVEVKNNFKKIFCLLYCVSVFMICFSREAVEYLVGNKYAQSLPVLPLLVLSFFLYSILYFWVRSVLLPSSNRRIIGVSFVIMVVVTCLAVVLLAMAGKGTGGAAWGTFMGVACAVWYAGAMLHRKCDIRFIDGDILLIVLSGIPLLIVSVLGAGTSLKAVLLMADALLLLKILDDKGIFVLKRMFSR